MNTEMIIIIVIVIGIIACVQTKNELYAYGYNLSMSNPNVICNKLKGLNNFNQTVCTLPGQVYI